jgi:hypothetical protein
MVDFAPAGRRKPRHWHRLSSGVGAARRGRRRRVSCAAELELNLVARLPGRPAFRERPVGDSADSGSVWELLTPRPELEHPEPYAAEG